LKIQRFRFNSESDQEEKHFKNVTHAPHARYQGDAVFAYANRNFYSIEKPKQPNQSVIILTNIFTE